MSRGRLVILWLVIMLVTPILLTMMLLQAVFGAANRALSMAIAFDECGSSLFGGDPRETISRRTGLAVIAGKSWGIWLAPKIDFFFGAGHCAAKAAEVFC